MKGCIPFIVAIGSEPDGLHLGLNGILLAIYMVVMFYNLSIVIKRKIVYIFIRAKFTPKFLQLLPWYQKKVLLLISSKY